MSVGWENLCIAKATNLQLYFSMGSNPSITHVVFRRNEFTSKAWYLQWVYSHSYSGSTFALQIQIESASP